MLRTSPAAKQLMLVLVFAIFMSTSFVAKAEEDFAAITGIVNLMDSFLGLMNSFYDMSANNEKAVLLQMHAIEEIYKDQGRHKGAVAVYENVLQKSNNSTVRNIAYHRLADVLKETGDMDGAIEVLNNALEETLKKTK